MLIEFHHLKVLVNKSNESALVSLYIFKFPLTWYQILHVRDSRSHVMVIGLFAQYWTAWSSLMINLDVVLKQ